MSVRGEILFYPINGTQEQTWDGFSWPGFFFGAIWLAIKQLWVRFIVSLLIIIATGGFGAIPVWIFYGFTGNGFHKKSLLGRGYLRKDQYENENKSTSLSNDVGEKKQVHVADELSKLLELKKTGALTEEEFMEQKKRLLSK
jgi:hypothetical protein